MATLQEQLSILVHLSEVDNRIAEEEIKLIHYIGKLHDLSKEEIEEIVINPLPIPSLRDVPEDLKFEYLFNVVQLMKVDGKVFQSEIEFCERIATKLGYQPSVIADLSAYIYSDPGLVTDRTFLRRIADKHKSKML